MLDEPMIKTMPAVETKIEHLIARVPALEVKLDEVSVERLHANDEVFQHTPSDADNLMGLMGMVSGMMLLHDVAVDTMQDFADDVEGHLQREKSEDEEDQDDEDD